MDVKIGDEIIIHYNPYKIVPPGSRGIVKKVYELSSIRAIFATVPDIKTSHGFVLFDDEYSLANKTKPLIFNRPEEL